MLSIPTAFLALALQATAARPPLPDTLEPPASRRTAAVDVLHGTEVRDPYRWLEAMRSDEVLGWAARQDAHTDAVLARMGGRPAIAARLERVLEFPSLATPVRPRQRPERVFFARRAPGEAQGRVFLREDGRTRVVLDPNARDPDGDTYVNSWNPDPTGARIAYAWSRGERWKTLRVRDLESGEDLPDRLRGLTSTGTAWLPDGSGFFYAAYDPPEGGVFQAELRHPRIALHRLGTPQSADVVIHAPEDWKDKRLAALRVTPDERYLVFEMSDGARPENALFVLDLEATRHDAAPRELFPIGLAQFHYEANEGPRLLLRTTLEAPRGRLVALDLRATGTPELEEVVAQREESLAWISRVGERLVACYIDAAVRRMLVLDLAGRVEREVPFEDASGVFFGIADRLDGERTTFGYTSLVDPGTLFELDLATGERTILERAEALSWVPEEFVTEQVFYRSKDGTRVPMFLSHAKGLERDGTNHVLLYGYGAYGWAAYPWFNALRITWLESGGIFAVPGLRGGGEYGEEWHRAGKTVNKQNTVDDFLAAAEFLVEQGWTRPDKLALQGGSASGILPGAALNQRPELFRAALVNWPMIDVIRYARFPGKSAVIPEYGSVEDEAEFRALLAYSPYHNVVEGAHYPAVFVTTGSEDATTVPCHAYKYVAALQTAQAGEAPILLRVDWGGPHYPASLRGSARIWADQLTFLFHELGVAWRPEGARTVEAGAGG